MLPMARRGTRKTFREKLAAMFRRASNRRRDGVKTYPGGVVQRNVSARIVCTCGRKHYQQQLQWVSAGRGKGMVPLAFTCRCGASWELSPADVTANMTYVNGVFIVDLRSA